MPAISTSPVRASPSLALTSSATVPVPAPEAPADTVIHGTWLTACQAQPAPAVTVTSSRAPSVPASPCVGESVKAHARTLRYFEPLLVDDDCALAFNGLRVAGDAERDLRFALATRG